MTKNLVVLSLWKATMVALNHLMVRAVDTDAERPDQCLAG
jgi:hypothetical protein